MAIQVIIENFNIEKGLVITFECDGKEYQFKGARTFKGGQLAGLCFMFTKFKTECLAQTESDQFNLNDLLGVTRFLGFPEFHGRTVVEFKGGREREAARTFVKLFTSDVFWCGDREEIRTFMEKEIGEDLFRVRLV